jgi:hypothetical protein
MVKQEIKIGLAEMPARFNSMQATVHFCCTFPLMESAAYLFSLLYK